MLKMIKALIAVSALAMITACGGGGGGSGTSSSTESNPQLAASVVDLSNYKNTFADTTLANGEVVASNFNLKDFFDRFKLKELFPVAYAADITACNDNVKPVAIESTGGQAKYKKLSVTSNTTDKPCFTSSQEVGGYIAAQAKNLYQGSKKCDIILMPKIGGTIHCFSAGIPESITTGAGGVEFKFKQAFAGIASLKSLGGKITENGKYFFVAFSDDGTKTKGYDGVYRFDLTESTPKGQLAYIASSVNPRTLSFDGYQQLENGDMIVTRMDLIAPQGSRRIDTYYVGVANTFPGVDSHQVVLINTAIQGGYEATSPIFMWAKNNLAVGGETITSGGSNNIVFSASQSTTDKSFYIILNVNRYKTFAGEYFNSLLIKATVSGTSISFQDYGPTSISFMGTVGINADLTKIYFIRPMPAGQMTLVTRLASPLTSNTDRTYMPETVTALSTVIPSDYVPTLLYGTSNKIFVSVVRTDFYDTNGKMNLKLFSIDKTASGVYWTDRANNLTEISLTNFTGNNFTVDSIIPSLTVDRLNFRINRLTDSNKFNLDVSAAGVDSIDLGAKGSISSKHAVVSGK
jgi:hypothetical protein